MYQIPIYRAERELGLEDAIRSNASIAYCSAIKPSDKAGLTDKAIARLKKLHNSAKAGVEDFDLYPLTSVLATTGWNRNDDVFHPIETWVARKTPEDKQLNYEHDDSKIIGHITNNWVIADDGNLVPDDSLADSLPDKFHVITKAVLYKQWATPELQERMDDIIAEIAEGKWYVSMECLFQGFDYALQGSDGTTRIVARNEKTAFMSKHLRVLGGSGKYGDYKVGRLMRNIIFSGKGLVLDPANPESVIFGSNSENFSASKAIYTTDISTSGADQVYSLPAEIGKEESVKENSIAMTLTLEQYQARVTDLTNEIEKLKASQTDAAINGLKTKLDEAVAAKTAADELLAKANDAINSIKADSEAKASEIATLKKSIADHQDEIKSLYAEKTKATRLSQVKASLGLEDAEATQFVETNAGLNDEAFNKQVEFVAKTVAAMVAKTAPKATPAKDAPKATSAPAPMAGKASTEVDESGEKAVASTDLSTASPAQKDASLSTSVTDSGVSDVQKAIASALGYKDESASK